VSKVKKGRGYVYSIQYHIVWCVKYRRKVLTGVVEEKFKEILFKIADENGFTIEEFNCDQDHVHLLIDCKPQHYIPNFIKALKGVSGRFIFKECPWLKDCLWGGHLWNPSYFVATVSENTEAQVREYIRSQKEK
jgi:putative transposase